MNMHLAEYLVFADLNIFCNVYIQLYFAYAKGVTFLCGKFISNLNFFQLHVTPVL